MKAFNFAWPYIQIRVHLHRVCSRGLNVAPGKKGKNKTKNSLLHVFTGAGGGKKGTWCNRAEVLQQIIILRLFGGKVHGVHDHAGARCGAGAEVEGEGGKERAPGLRVVADHGRILSAARHPKVCLFGHERVRFVHSAGRHLEYGGARLSRTEGQVLRLEAGKKGRLYINFLSYSHG